jgi:hypothetical protein
MKKNTKIFNDKSFERKNEMLFLCLHLLYSWMEIEFFVFICDSISMNHSRERGNNECVGEIYLRKNGNDSKNRATWLRKWYVCGKKRKCLFCYEITWTFRERLQFWGFFFFILNYVSWTIEALNFVFSKFCDRWIFKLCGSRVKYIEVLLSQKKEI